MWNALEVVNEISQSDRQQMQAQAATLPLLAGALPDIQVHFDGEHSGDFQYPAIVDVATHIKLEKLSSFSFGDIQVRRMPNDMRVLTDRWLEGVKARNWAEYSTTIRRSFIITELYYGSVSVSLDTKVSGQADVKVLTDAGFSIASKDAISRTEVYKMTKADVPFAMQTERLKRFSA